MTLKNLSTTKVVAYKEKDFDNFDDARQFIETWVDLGYPVRTCQGGDKYRVTVYQWRTAQ